MNSQKDFCNFCNYKDIYILFVEAHAYSTVVLKSAVASACALEKRRNSVNSND